MNKVTLIGRLTKDPDTKTAVTTTVTSFTLAVNRKFVKEGEQRQADFIMCKAFGKTAEFCAKYYTKGQQVAISGRINTGSYEKDGQKIYTTDVIVEDAYFADSKRNDGGGDSGGNSAAGTPGFLPLDNGEEELPF